VHATRSSIADGAFENDVETLLQMRRLIDFLPRTTPTACRNGRASMTSGGSTCLDTADPRSSEQALRMKELILKVVDEGDSRNLRGLCENIVTGFGRIAGVPSALSPTSRWCWPGVLDSDASRKAARFVRFCDAFNIPIVTFVDVPVFCPALPEYGGLIKHGAKTAVRLFAMHGAAGHHHHPKKPMGGAFDVMASKEIGADMNYAGRPRRSR